MFWINPMKIYTSTLLVFVIKNISTQAKCISQTAKEFENNCYELINTPLSWTKAQEYCWLHGKRSLAKVGSQLVLAFLNSLKPSYIRDVWLGANDKLQEGKWVWTDGSTANLTPMWDDKEPNNLKGNEHCLESNGLGKLNDLPCSEQRTFICMEVHETTQMPETTRSTTKMTPSTTKTTPTTITTTPSTITTTPSKTKTALSTIATTPSTIKTTSSTTKTALSTITTAPSTITSTPSTTKTSPTTKMTPSTTKTTNSTTITTPSTTITTPSTAITTPSTTITTPSTTITTLSTTITTPSTTITTPSTTKITSPTTKMTTATTKSTPSTTQMTPKTTKMTPSTITTTPPITKTTPSIITTTKSTAKTSPSTTKKTPSTITTTPSTTLISTPLASKTIPSTIIMTSSTTKTTPSTTKTTPSTITTTPSTITSTPSTTKTSSTTKMTPLTTNTTNSTTKTTPSTITTTPSTTATSTPSATEVIIDDDVPKAGRFSSYTLDSTSPQPIVLDARESNVKFIQPTLVTFTVGLSKQLDVLLHDVVFYNKVVSNVGDDYNNSTGVFRCNIAGVYFFQIHGAAGEGKELSLSLVKNKTRVISLYSSTNQELSLAANSAVLLLEAGDEVFVEASNCGSLYGEEHHVINTFSGFLLGTSIVNY